MNDAKSYLSLVKAATNKLESGQIDYKDWAKAVIGEELYSQENLRRCYMFFSKFLECLDDEELENINGVDKYNEIIDAKEELIKERKKLQAVNLQAQEYYRERARSELLAEQIQDAIKGLKPFEVKEFTHTKPTKKVAILTIADAHYDSNFEVNGLFGEKVNVYDKETFKTRMWNLLAKIEADYFDFDKIKVVSMGDAIENILRLSSLKKLRQPVVESVIEFAEFMSTWLVALHNRLEVPVEFALVPGNHSVCRILSQKPEFQDENLEYIIHAFIQLRLGDCKGIKIEPYNDVYFTTIFNENIVFSHGETKDLEALMNHFENLYDITIDACYGAHYHSESSKSIGVGNVGSRRIVRVPSMVGTDPYSNQILKHNRAGAYFAIFDEEGESLNKIYFLN